MILRKCKLPCTDRKPAAGGLAHLGIKWLPGNVPVPEYRVWSLQVKGNFVGLGGGYFRRNVPIPIPLIEFLSDATKESYEKLIGTGAALRQLYKTLKNFCRRWWPDKYDEMRTYVEDHP
jgi:hypothetical protein